MNSNADDIFAKVQAGQLEDEVSSPTPKTIRAVRDDPESEAEDIANVGDRTYYLTMNLTQPPFDDIHVRKAMNLIIDKAALQKAWGGPIPGSIATHIVPPVLYNNASPTTTRTRRRITRATSQRRRHEMKLSKYDPNKTGKCTSRRRVKNVLMIADTRAVDKRMVPIIEADAAKIGITFKVRSINGAYTTIQTPSKNIPISDRPSWGKDYADPYTFFDELFDGSAIITSGNTNYSLVGLTPAIAKKVGAKGNDHQHPDRRPGHRQLQRPSRLRPARPCWENLDKKLMTKVVPWVPYLWPNNVFIVGPNGHALELRPVHATGPRTRRSPSSSNDGDNGGGGHRRAPIP